MWQLIDPANLDQTVRLASSVLVPVVQQHAMASRAFSNEHYLDQRMRSGIIEPYLPQVTPLPTPQQVYQYVGWATEPARTATAPDEGESSVPQLLVPAQAKTVAALQKLVADTGRQQIVDNVLDDRHARAWAREARPDACWFCAMLATRGAAYGSAWTAGARSFEGIPYNSYHRNCHCQVIPMFQAYEPPAHVREWQNMWQQATKNVYGKGKLLAFKAAYQGKDQGDMEDDQHVHVPDVASAFDGWDDAKLQEAIDTAQAILDRKGEAQLGGKRSEWISKLKAEQARRAVLV